MILDQDQKFFGFKISVNPPLSASGGFWFWVKDDGTFTLKGHDLGPGSTSVTIFLFEGYCCGETTTFCCYRCDNLLLL
jgi:hypothetical protein